MLVLDDLTPRSGLDPLTLDRSQGSDLLMDDSGLNDPLTGRSRLNIVGLDWERDGWRVSYGGSPASRLSRDDLLNEPFSDADYVVVEQAHLRERNVYSVAQVYAEDELRRLACHSKIRLFPGKMSWRASEFAGNVRPDGRPDKDRDAESIATFAVAHPEKLQTWKRYYLPEDDPSRQYWGARDELREELREALNPLRVAWNNKRTAERYELPEVVLFCRLLDANFDRLPEGAKAQYGIRRGRNGIRVERMSSAITVFLSVYDREGNIRSGRAGKPIGCRFILDSIGMSHSYKPNMARSQLTWHGMRHYKGPRSEYMRNMRNFIAFLKNAD